MVWGNGISTIQKRNFLYEWGSPYFLTPLRSQRKKSACLSRNPRLVSKSSPTGRNPFGIFSVLVSGRTRRRDLDAVGGLSAENNGRVNQAAIEG